MNDTTELRSKIYRISLTKINDIYYVPPGIDGSVGLSDEQIDQVMSLICAHDTARDQALLEKLPERFPLNMYTTGTGKLVKPQSMGHGYMAGFNAAIDQAKYLLTCRLGKQS